VHNDDIYLNDGRPFFVTPPKAQELAKSEELDKILAQLPLLKERMDYLDKKIAFYGDVDSIPVDLNADPQAHRNQVAVNKLMKAELQAERSWIEGKVRKVKR